MNASSRIFGAHAETYAACDLSVFPVDTRHKRPAIRGWQKATPNKARVWASVEKLGDADGLGVLMGKSHGLTEIDVDAVGEAWLAAALERFGETPITIRSASGKAKLWYRHNGERRHIRPFAEQPIDVLGSGFTIAPPSWREDLGAAYVFRTGGLEKISALPTINAGALDMGLSRAPEAVTQGERNNALWRYCMAQARYCDDAEALIDVALSWSSAFNDPLEHDEAKRCARSAWKYETTGRNYLGLLKPQLNEGDRIMDSLLDHPEAYTLYQMLLRWHRNKQSFAIAPTAMSEAASPPWSRRKIEGARDVLLERGFIEELRSPKRRLTGLYRLSRNNPISANNHNTPLPPSMGMFQGDPSEWRKAHRMLSVDDGQDAA